MEALYGLPVPVMAVLLSLCGIAVTIILGWKDKPGEKLNGRKILKTFVITFIVTVPVVATQLSVISSTINNTELLIIIFGIIETVAGGNFVSYKLAKRLASDDKVKPKQPGI